MYCPLLVRFNVSTFFNAFNQQLPPGNRGNDADFVPIFQRRRLILQKANVLFIDVHVDEAVHLPFLIHQSFLDPRISGLQFGDCVANGGAIHFHNFFVIG